jgi:prepilin-type N-terminal cleavage/methylation domain-containing protein
MKIRFIHHPSRGFTLTELLVVILIIVVIAALALIGIRRMREGADKVTSARNLSQLQIANASYAADHNGNCVPYLENNDAGQRVAWWYQNQEFLKNLVGEVLDKSGNPVKAVPPSYLDPKVYRARKALYTSMAASYGMSDNGVAGSGNEPNAAPCHNLNRMPDPSRSMAFATATDVRINYNSRFNWKETDSKTSDGAIAYRYGNKALVVYFDGHIGEMGKSDIKQIDTSRGGKNSPFWNPTAQ